MMLPHTMALPGWCRWQPPAERFHSGEQALNLVVFVLQVETAEDAFVIRIHPVALGEIFLDVFLDGARRQPRFGNTTRFPTQPTWLKA